MKTALTAAFAAALFAIGLLVSGMTMPAKIIGFLDVGGSWDPSLVLTMGAALVVYIPIARIVLRRKHPVLDHCFHVPSSRAIDAPLLGGAVIFGIGWGLAGYCPGPAIVSAGAGATGTFAFLGAMVVGMLAVRVLGINERQPPRR